MLGLSNHKQTLIMLSNTKLLQVTMSAHRHEGKLWKWNLWKDRWNLWVEKSEHSLLITDMKTSFMSWDTIKIQVPKKSVWQTDPSRMLKCWRDGSSFSSYSVEAHPEMKNWMLIVLPWWEPKTCWQIGSGGRSEPGADLLSYEEVASTWASRGALEC